MSGRFTSAAAGAAALAALIVGIVYGTHVAGGSDSSCYLNSARLLSRGAVALEEPLVRDAPWPNAGQTFSPAGFSPSRVDPARLVAICSPGLSLAMAAFRLLRINEFLVVPLLGALAVWLTYVIGRRMDRPMTGAAAALLVVCSPTFLYQVVQPMSDVPAMAWWLLAVAWTIGRDGGSSRPGLAGLAASMALLTRPNLLPLAAAIGIYLLASADKAGRVAAISRFTGGLVPGVVLLAVIHNAMYGSPLATGYGDVEAMMSAGHVGPNLRRYVEWLLWSHTPVLLVGPAAPAVIRHPRHAWLCLGFAGTTLACYLPYAVFDDWSYTRFLLPAIPLLIVMSVVTLVALAERLVPRLRYPAVAVFVAAVMTLWIANARARHAFDLSDLEQHFYRAGTAVAAHVAGPAAIVTVKNSGSVRYYAGLPIVSWDALEPDALDRALAFVRGRGHPPYLLLEIDEEQPFRERFRGASVLGALDWPPRMQVGRTIRLYDPLERVRFLEDGKARTEFIREAPVPRRDWRRWFARR